MGGVAQAGDATSGRMRSTRGHSTRPAIRDNRASPRVKFAVSLQVPRRIVTLAALASLTALDPARAVEPPILIGQSVSLTGPVAEHGQGVAQGAKLVFDAVNAAGGVNGRRIALAVLDDGADAKRSADNAKQLVDRDGVVALFGGVEGGPCVAQLREAAARSVPLVACVAGSPEMREPFSRMSFPVRAPHVQEFAKLLDIAKSYGMTRAAFVHADSDTGRLHLANVRRLADARGIAVVPIVAAAGATPETLAGALVQANVDAVFNHGSYATYAALIKAAREKGSRVQFMAVNSGAAQMAKLLGPDAKGLIFTQVVPFPWAVAVPVVKEYRQALALASPETAPSFSGLEGYIGAKVLVAGLRAAGKDLSRAGVARAMESLGTIDVGGMSVAFAPGGHIGSTFVDTVIVTVDGRFAR
jgi:branched-chain amino acid transport system substrate-binding protein